MTDSGGTTEGFEAQLDPLFRLARRAAHRILLDDATADEVAEETMVRAYTRWSSIADHAEPWVTRVASNLAISQWRRRRVAADASRLSLPPPVVMADASIDRIDLAKAISGLSRRQREVVALRYLLDLSEAEVAETLGCSPGSVSRHTARALARLREVMPHPSMEVASDV